VEDQSTNGNEKFSILQIENYEQLLNLYRQQQQKIRLRDTLDWMGATLYGTVQYWSDYQHLGGIREHGNS